MEIKLKRVTRASEDGKPEKITLKWTGTDPYGVEISMTVTGPNFDDLSRFCPIRTGQVAQITVERAYEDITQYAAREEPEQENPEQEPPAVRALANAIQKAREINQAKGIRTETDLAEEFQGLAHFYRAGQDPREVTDPEALQRRRLAAADAARTAAS